MKKDKFFRGFVGYGELTKADWDFLRPDFDAKRQQGQRAVGMFGTASRPGVVTRENAQLEGDDIE